MFRKNIAFLFSIEKEVKIISKTGDEITKTVFYRLLFVDSPRFMLPSIKSC